VVGESGRKLTGPRPAEQKEDGEEGMEKEADGRGTRMLAQPKVNTTEK
jgi:hypothetical protein